MHTKNEELNQERYLCVFQKKGFQHKESWRGEKKNKHMEAEAEERCQDDSWAVDLTSHLSRLERAEESGKDFFQKSAGQNICT